MCLQLLISFCPSLVGGWPWGRYSTTRGDLSVRQSGRAMWRGTGFAVSQLSHPCSTRTSVVYEPQQLNSPACIRLHFGGLCRLWYSRVWRMGTSV